MSKTSIILCLFDHMPRRPSSPQKRAWVKQYSVTGVNYKFQEWRRQYCCLNFWSNYWKCSLLKFFKHKDIWKVLQNGRKKFHICIWRLCTRFVLGFFKVTSTQIQLSSWCFLDFTIHSLITSVWYLGLVDWPNWQILAKVSTGFSWISGLLSKKIPYIKNLSQL